MQAKLTLVQLAVAASLITGAASAGATTFALGAVPANGDPLVYTRTLTAGTFFDTFTFSLPSNLGSAYSVVDIPLNLPGASFKMLVTNLNLFWAGADGDVGTVDDSFLASASSVPGAGKLELPYEATMPGNYYIDVSGRAVGSAGGIYTVAIGITPVPEPENYAMFLAGLGVMGAIAMRRRNKSN